MIGRIAILLLAGILAGLCWRVLRRAHAGRQRRLRRLEIELRLAGALEAFDQEVFRLKHYRVLRPNGIRQNAGLIPSKNLSSLRYIKGRQNED